MTTQNLADFMSHVGAVVSGAVIMFLVYYLVTTIILCRNNDIEIVSTGKSAYIKKDGKKYPITDNDIPGIVTNGPGKIVLYNNDCQQTLRVSGFENAGFDIIQANGITCINGINIIEMLS